MTRPILSIPMNGEIVWKCRIGLFGTRAICSSVRESVPKPTMDYKMTKHMLNNRTLKESRTWLLACTWHCYFISFNNEHPVFNAVYRFSMQYVVLEISRGLKSPPPPGSRLAQTPAGARVKVSILACTNSATVDQVRTLCSGQVSSSDVRRQMTPFPWASTVTNGSAKAESQLCGWRDPFPWTNPLLRGPGSELFTCLSVPPSGGGWQRGGAISVPAGIGSNGPITAKPDRGDWPWRCPLAVWSSQLQLL